MDGDAAFFDDVPDDPLYKRASVAQSNPCLAGYS